MPSIPSTKRYRNALQRLARRITPNQRRMLCVHCAAPRRRMTATELAEAVGFKGHRGVNGQYGRLGSLLRDELDWHEEGQRSFVIATFIPPSVTGERDWVWIMHQQLAKALEDLGWDGDGE